jgi:hypothetical protein
MAGWVNTAHVALGATVEILYPYHPFFGHAFIVVGTLGNGNIWVRQAGGRRVTIPAWMTDKWFCQTITHGEFPTCSVPALIDLQDLLATMVKPESQ